MITVGVDNNVPVFSFESEYNEIADIFCLSGNHYLCKLRVLQHALILQL